MHTFWLLLVLASGTASAGVEPAPVRVDAKQLMENPDPYLGKVVSVRSCLVNTPHGAFIHPCGTDGHIITLDVSNSKADLIADTFFKRLKTDFSVEVKADIVGKLTKRIGQAAGKTRVINVLQLQKICSPVVYEP